MPKTALRHKFCTSSAPRCFVSGFQRKAKKQFCGRDSKKCKNANHNAAGSRCTEI